MDLLDKLCTVALFAADSNFLNKYIGCDLMYCAELFGQLANKQFGSRKLHRAITQNTNKRLTFDRLLKKGWRAALCSNNAKSCYLCIFLAVAALCMQQQGIPAATIACMFTTLQNMEHTIQAMFGDSTSTWGAMELVEAMGWSHYLGRCQIPCSLHVTKNGIHMFLSSCNLRL